MPPIQHHQQQLPPLYLPPPLIPLPLPPSQQQPTWQKASQKGRRAPTKQQPHFQNSNRFQCLHTEDLIATQSPNTGPPNATNMTQMPKPVSPAHRQKTCRPQAILNQHPEMDTPSWLTTIPGNNTFADALKHDKKVALFSDSICNRFSAWDINRKIINGQLTKRSFPGATSQDLSEHHIMPTLKNNTPDIAIIHVGINDVMQCPETNGLTSHMIEEIARAVIKCGTVCRLHGVNRVCISSILPKKGYKSQLAIKHINDQISKMCKGM